MVAISTHDGLTIVERVARNVDRAAVNRAEGERIMRVNVERRELLYSRLFQNVPAGADVTGLRTESAAQELFARALACSDSRLQVAILRAAIDNRWGSIVRAFVKTWDDHPTANTAQELWNLTLTTGRPTV